MAPPRDRGARRCGVTSIEIRDPTLVVLVGAAGSGKSTFAARWFDPSEVLSSDAFREILSGDAADQRATKTAFSIIHREVTKRLAAGRTVVVDATNVEPSARRQLVARAHVRGRSGRRDRVRAATRRRPREERARARSGSSTRRSSSAISSALERTLPGLADERFATVLILRSPADVEAVSLVRA